MALNKEVIPQTERRPQARGVWSIHDALDRMINDFFGAEAEPFAFRAGNGLEIPSVDVADTEKEIVVSAELPGMDEKNIDVSLSKDSLIIKGEKKEEQEEKRKGYYRKERHFGSVYREIALPCEIQADKISATFSKGVLKVTLPKTAQAQRESVKIPVKPA